MASLFIQGPQKCRKIIEFWLAEQFVCLLWGGRQTRCHEMCYANAEIKWDAERREFLCAGGVWVCTPSELLRWGASRIRNIYLLDRLTSLLLTIASLLPLHLVIYIMGNFSAFSISFFPPVLKINEKFLYSRNSSLLSFVRSFRCFLSFD